MSTSDYAARLYRTVSSLAPGDQDVQGRTPHFQARSAGRFLEEAVELALAFGLGPGDIMGHVADALHNEARKAGRFPSELRPQPTKNEQIIEIGDCALLLDYLRENARISELTVQLAMQDKVRVLEQRALAGRAVVVDGLMYKAGARL